MPSGPGPPHYMGDSWQSNPSPCSAQPRALSSSMAADASGQKATPAMSSAGKSVRSERPTRPPTSTLTAGLQTAPSGSSYRSVGRPSSGHSHLPPRTVRPGARLRSTPTGHWARAGSGPQGGACRVTLGVVGSPPHNTGHLVANLCTEPAFRPSWVLSRSSPPRPFDPMTHTRAFGLNP
jgi:hypothetical protein